MPTGAQRSEPSILSLNQLTAGASPSTEQGNAAAAGSWLAHHSTHRTTPHRSPRDTPDHRSVAVLRAGVTPAAHVIDLTAEDSASPRSSADSGVLTLPAEGQSTHAAGHEGTQHQALAGGVRPARHSARTERRLSDLPDATDAAVHGQMQRRGDTHSDPVVACTRKRRRWDVGPPGTALDASPWPSGQQLPAERSHSQHYPLPGPSVRHTSDAVPASMAGMVDSLVDRPHNLQHTSGDGSGCNESFRVSRPEQDQQESHLPARQLPSAPDSLYEDTQQPSKRTRHDSGDRQSRQEYGHRRASQRRNSRTRFARHEKSHRHRRSRSGQNLCQHSGCQHERGVKTHSSGGGEPHAHRTLDADCCSDTASHAQDRWQLWQSGDEAILY